nr:hypothetical protein [Solirubrobacter soli]
MHREHGRRDRRIVERGVPPGHARARLREVRAQPEHEQQVERTVEDRLLARPRRRELVSEQRGDALESRVAQDDERRQGREDRVGEERIEGVGAAQEGRLGGRGVARRQRGASGRRGQDVAARRGVARRRRGRGHGAARRRRGASGRRGRTSRRGAASRGDGAGADGTSRGDGGAGADGTSRGDGAGADGTSRGGGGAGADAASRGGEIVVWSSGSVGAPGVGTARYGVPAGTRTMSPAEACSDVSRSNQTSPRRTVWTARRRRPPNSMPRSGPIVVRAKTEP